jgi:hypothetical protein
MATYYKIDMIAETSIKVENAKISHRIKRNNYMLIGSSLNVPIQQIRTALTTKLNEQNEFKMKAMHPEIIDAEIFHFYKENVFNMAINENYIIIQCNSRGEFIIKE